MAQESSSKLAEASAELRAQEDPPPLEELVPHRAPMLLLDRVLSHDAENVVCQVTIRADSAFLESIVDRANLPPEVMVPAVVGIEYMAQCVASFAGLAARATGGTPRIGFLIGCRELTLEVDGFRIGDTLEVRARRVWGENNVGSFVCEIARETKTVAKGILTVYQGPLPDHAETSAANGPNNQEGSKP